MTIFMGTGRIFLTVTMMMTIMENQELEQDDAMSNREEEEELEDWMPDDNILNVLWERPS
jgi:hypothetical protein